MPTPDRTALAAWVAEQQRIHVPTAEYDDGRQISASGCEECRELWPCSGSKRNAVIAAAATVAERAEQWTAGCTCGVPEDMAALGHEPDCESGTALYYEVSPADFAALCDALSALLGGAQ